MKNIYIIDEFMSSLKNGIGTFLQEFLYCVEQMDVNTCVVSFNSNHYEFLIEPEGKIRKMHFPIFPSGNFMSHPEIAMRFFRLYIEDSPNNIFFINYSPCVDFMQLIRDYMPLSKIIFIIHDLSWTSVCLGDSKKWLNSINVSQNNASEKERWLIKAYKEEKKMFSLANVVVCLSLSTYKTLNEIYNINEDKIRLIPNGLQNRYMIYTNKNQLRKSVNIVQSEKIILFVGRTTKAKGFKVLIEAFRLILKQIPNVRLIIAGAIDKIDYQEDISSKITYLNHINQDHLKKWYRISDIGVISSYSEQCSYTGIEMMQAGLPIVASDGFGVRDMFHDGINAIVAKIGNRDNDMEYIQNLATSLMELIESGTMRAKFKNTGKQLVSSIYSIQQMKINYQKLIDEL